MLLQGLLSLEETWGKKEGMFPLPTTAPGALLG